MSLTYEQRQQLRQAVDRRRREKVSFLTVERQEAALGGAYALVAPSTKPKLVPANYWTKQKMIAAAREWHRLHGRSPCRPDWLGGGSYHPAGSTVCRRLGSWEVLLDMAGLPRNRSGLAEIRGRVWTQESVVLAVGRWADRHGRPPRWGDWVRAGEDWPSYKTVRKYCGSFAAAWEMAGVSA